MFLRALLLVLGMLGHVFAMDKAALLAAIGAHPGEDTPRLALADWLEEHEDATRAEFIRVQVRLARMASDDSDRSDLEAREKTLLKENAIRWLPKAFDLAFDDGGSRVVWERGFAHGLVLSRACIVNSAKMRAAFDELLFLKSIDVTADQEFDVMSAQGVRTFTSSLLKLKRIAELVHLGLHNGLVDYAQAVRLASFPFTKLASLDLSNNQNPTCDSALAELLNAPWMRKLRRLDLTSFSLPPANWVMVASTDALPELEELRGSWRWSELAFGGGMPKLRRLTMWMGATGTSEPLVPFFSSQRFRRLRSLDVVVHGISTTSPDLAAQQVFRAMENRPHGLVHLGFDDAFGFSVRPSLTVLLPPTLAAQIAENATKTECVRELELLSTL